jgi:outer membrane receptor for ferrienterochelin and colicin
MFDDNPPSTGPLPAEGVETVTRASGGSSTLIVRAELEELTGRTAMEAIENLNQRWLQVRRGVSLRDGPNYARVVVDEITRRELDELHRWNADEIEYMRYLTGPDATIKYGSGFPGGVIEVITRDGR